MFGEIPKNDFEYGFEYGHIIINGKKIILCVVTYQSMG